MSLERVVERLKDAMEDADHVPEASGPAKKKFVLESVRSLTKTLMDESEANLVNALAPFLVDLVCEATKGNLAVNLPKRCRWPPCS